MVKEKVFSKQVISLLVIVAIALLVLGINIFRTLPDGKLHLIFCDVGQGDGILLKTPKGDKVLIDGGPDDSVLSCLGKFMPFYDRNLELMVLTHPQADHMTGLVSVFERYNVEKVLRTTAVNKTAGFEEFRKAEISEKSQEFKALSDSKINLDTNLTATILWPSPGNLASVADLNDTAIVLRVDFGQFCALLTADAGNFVWAQLSAAGKLSRCYLLKVAHHGSKNATNEQFLESVSPKIAVISVGINNLYGHPHKQVIEELQRHRIQVLRTDQKGTIEIVSDGKKVEVRD